MSEIEGEMEWREREKEVIYIVYINYSTVMIVSSH